MEDGHSDETQLPTMTQPKNKPKRGTLSNHKPRAYFQRLMIFEKWNCEMFYVREN